MRNRAASIPLVALSLGLLLTACGGTGEVGTPVTSTADSGPGSLREVLAAAKDGDTLRFTTTGTVTLASPLTLSKDVTVLADGVTLDAAGRGRVLEVAAGAEVTLKGGTLQGGVGQPIESAAPASQALSKATWGGNLINRGNLTLDGTTVTGGKAMNGGGIYNDAGASLTLRDVTVTANEAFAPTPDLENESTGSGGGVANRGTLTVESGTLRDNTAYYTGGGIRNTGTLNMRGGHVDGNRCTFAFSAQDNVFSGCSGGGIVSTGPVTMTGGTVNGNTSTLVGGGLFVFQAPLTLSGGEISGNTTGRGGGGVMVNTGTLDLTGGTISNNKATREGGGGGGVLVYKTTMNFSGGVIRGNSAEAGGGIDAYTDNKVTMTGGTVEENTARGGGGLNVNTRSTLSFTGGTVRNNTASEYGGGITVSNAQGALTLGGAAALRGNKAGAQGGGLYVSGAALTMTDGTIEGNTAVDNGGGLALAGSNPATISGGVIAGNSVTGSEDGGGGIRIHRGATLNLYGGEVRDNTALQTGGGLVIGGTVNMTGGAIRGNRVTGTAQGQGGGGGIRMYTNGVMTASGGSIRDNTALFGGGVFVGGAFNNEPASRFTLAGATISGNRATAYDGGGILNDGVTSIQSGGVTGNSAVTKGGGVSNTRDATFTQTGGSVTGNTPDNISNP
ncbi:hypothetical protein DAERI_040116 [Deinococcus aerius]|uniref:Polymorphic outer membrane protein n=1 Tax=Deinococcus aerius TaxID=200253 RepID=A0A2I9D419_9DEIO|nr:hypothetical protein [Deinococcus aerius]GBF05356.1 hypothetical protein DAERI_040116 [Deinococcus aerius]